MSSTAPCVSTTTVSMRSSCSKTCSNLSPSEFNALPTSSKLCLARRQLPQAIEEQAMSQFVVRLDFTAEEIGKVPPARAVLHVAVDAAVSQVWILGQVVSDRPRPVGTVHHALGIGISLETGRLTGNLPARQVLRREQARLTCRLEISKAFLAEVGGCSVEMIRCWFAGTTAPVRQRLARQREQATS